MGHLDLIFWEKKTTSRVNQVVVSVTFAFCGFPMQLIRLSVTSCVNTNMITHPHQVLKDKSMCGYDYLYHICLYDVVFN
jgi:hypothetical protein